MFKKLIFNVAIPILLIMTAAFQAGADITLPVKVNGDQEAQISFYASIRFQTLSVTHSKETSNLPYSLFSSYDGLAPTNDDYSYLSFEMEKYVSRFGADFRFGKLKGKVELRPISSSIYRHWYAAVDTKAGEFLFGHTWDPLFLSGLISNSLAFGACSSPQTDLHNGLRLEQIRWTYASKDKGRIMVGLLKPDTNGGVTGITAVKKESSIPALRLTYASPRFGPISFRLFSGYNQYTITSATNDEYDMYGAVYGGGPSIDFENVGFGFNVWSGKNPNNFAYGPHYAYANAAYDAGSNTVKDADVSWGFHSQFYYKFNPAAKLVLEYGMRETEVPNVTGSAGYQRRLSTFTFALPFKDVICKGVTIMPTVEYVDWGKLEYNDTQDDLELGNTLAYGIYWQLDF